MRIFAETERLLLREILPTDIDGMYALDADVNVHKYLGSKPVASKEEISKIIAFIRQQYIDYGIGRWAIIEKTTNSFIGWSGLKFVTEETNKHSNYYDLGYRLIPRYWGKGIATESAIASLAYAFEVLDADEVYAMADCKNVGSNKILENLELQCIETFDLEGIKHNWYRIERDQFEGKKRNS